MFQLLGGGTRSAVMTHTYTVYAARGGTRNGAVGRWVRVRVSQEQRAQHVWTVPDRRVLATRASTLALTGRQWRCKQ